MLFNSYLFILFFLPLTVILYYTVGKRRNCTGAKLVLLLASGLAVTFAQEGIISRTGILNCPFVYWLGRVSISVYLIQNITRLTVKKLLDGRPVLFVFAAEFIVTVLCGIIAYGIIQKITQARRKSHD